MLPSEQVRKDIKELQRKISCCSKDELICLNEQETFTPLDPLNPTQEEVSAWAAEYLSKCQLRGSTYLSYYQPAYQVPEDIITFNFPFGTANIIITTFTFNGDVLTPAPPIEVTDALSAVTYIPNTITDVFNGWLSSQLGLSAFVGETTFTTNGILTFYDIAGTFEVTIEGTSDGVPFTFTASTIQIPSVGTCNEPTHVWATATEEIIQLLSPTQISNREYFIATEMTHSWVDGTPGAPPININTNKDTLLFEHQNGFVEYKSDITGTTWEKQTYHPYVYYPNTFFITTEGSENPTVGYLERAFTPAQYEALITQYFWYDTPLNSNINLVIISTSDTYFTVSNPTNSDMSSLLYNIIIPEYSNCTELYFTLDGYSGAYDISRINLYAYKNLTRVSGTISSNAREAEGLGEFSANCLNIETFTIGINYLDKVTLNIKNIEILSNNWAQITNVICNIDKVEALQLAINEVGGYVQYIADINIKKIQDVSSNLLFTNSDLGIYNINIDTIVYLNNSLFAFDIVAANNVVNFFINNIHTITSSVSVYVPTNDVNIYIKNINTISDGGLVYISTSDNDEANINGLLNIQVDTIRWHNNISLINNIIDQRYRINLSIKHITFNSGIIFQISNDLINIKYISIHIDRAVATANQINPLITMFNYNTTPITISGNYFLTDSNADYSVSIIETKHTGTCNFNFTNFYVWKIFKRSDSATVIANHANSSFYLSGADTNSGHFNSDVSIYLEQ